MLCPNCSYNLSKYKAGYETVLHCDICGGSFFEEGALDRISSVQAKELASIKRDDILSDTPKMCPKDHTILEPILSENIPPGVSLLECTGCHGVFLYPNDLLTYNKALAVKADYFKMWSKPLVFTGQTFALVVFLLVIGFSMFSVLSRLNERTNVAPRAQEVISNVSISSSGTYFLLSFRTSVPAQSKVIFYDEGGNVQNEKVVSKELSTFHYLTTGDMNVDGTVRLKIEIYNEKAEKIGESELLTWHKS